MKERRTKEQIYYDIMTVIIDTKLSTIKPTKLQLKTRLAYDKLQKYLKVMKLHKLIDSNYNITVKGNSFYHEWTSIIGQVYKLSQMLGYVVVTPGAKEITINQMKKIEECHIMLSDILGERK